MLGTCLELMLAIGISQQNSSHIILMHNL
jgi:hypothetical protein